MIKGRKNLKEATLFDRFAVGVLSAFMAAITYGFILSLVALFSDGALLLPIELFFIFILAMFFIGFFTLDNYFINISVPLWRLILKLFH